MHRPNFAKWKLLPFLHTFNFMNLEVLQLLETKNLNFRATYFHKFSFLMNKISKIKSLAKLSNITIHEVKNLHLLQCMVHLQISSSVRPKMLSPWSHFLYTDKTNHRQPTQTQKSWMQCKHSVCLYLDKYTSSQQYLCFISKCP